MLLNRRRKSKGAKIHTRVQKQKRDIKHKQNIDPSQSRLDPKFMFNQIPKIDIN